MSGGWGTPRRSPARLCKHCGRPISVGVPATHLAGGHKGKQRCDPDDSKLMYGYNAEPVGAECAYPCRGAEGWPE